MAHDQKRVKLEDHGTKEEEVREPNTITTGVDRFSQLPDSIICEILSSLPTIQAVRMSILSKRWRRIWYSLPFLYFNDSVVGGNFDLNKFHKFVGTCLELRKNDMFSATDTPVTKFELVLYKSKSKSITDGWLKTVAQSNVKELTVQTQNMRTHYGLPVDVLRSRSLTVLDLYFVRLWGLRSISLPSLVSLTLGVVKLNDEALYSLVLACCSLEELVLNQCEGVKWPKISSLSLKSLEIYCERKRTTFRIEAVNLEYFLGSGYAAYFDFGLSSYGALTELSFTCSRFSDEWLEALTLKLPVLECLTLTGCENLWDVKIRSEQLKYLTLERNGYSHINCTIDSPNLIRLEYEGYLSKKFSMNSQNLLEAEIKFEKPSEYDMDWYINLLKFLSSLNCSEYLSLDVSSEEALIFPKELQKFYSSPLPNLEDLEVKTSSPSADNSDLRDSLMWASPSLETLSIDPK